MADMFDLELHDGEAPGQDRQACCESDDDIIEIDDVSVGFDDLLGFRLTKIRILDFALQYV